MSIAVFGASGFLGQNLVPRFGSSERVQKISLRNDQWKSLINSRTNIYLNLIGKAHDHQGTATKEDYHYANVKLVQEIFQAFKNSEAHLFIHISSIAAVEEFQSQKPLEESAVSHSVSDYGKSKKEAEEWLMSQNMPAGKKVIILRPPMIHGPGDKGNLKLLYKFISKGIPYPLLAFNNQRSFLSIDNFIFFVQQIIEKSNSLTSGIYHIADDESVATKEIIAVISKETETKVSKLVLPKFLVKSTAFIGDVLPLPLNSKRLKKMTGSLTVSNHKIKQALNITRLPLTAKEGLAKTIKSFSE